jgi:TolB-like protein
MAQKTNSFERFWKELKRRKVIHVITVYAAVAFVILQLFDMIQQPLRLPDWTPALIIVLLCIGFVIAVFVSWIYDITPSGVKKTKPVSAAKHTDQTATPTSSGWKIATYISAVVILALLAFNFISRRNINADLKKLEKSIAVLPFANDSPDTTNLYFCNGMMDEILTQLQKIGGLKVKSRTSGERYRHPDKDIIVIGRELGVSLIVEGSVRKINDDLRITAQLINAKTGDHLWADNYDGKYTAKIFEFQSDVAKKVAKSLNAIITPNEKQLIEKVPTYNMTSHDLYLRANNFLKEYEKTNNPGFYQTAVNLYNAALIIDSTFAKAYTGLASAYYDRYQWETYFKENYLDSMKILLNKALLFDDQLDEAFYLKAVYYIAHGQFEDAMNNLDKALKLNPNYYLAYVAKGGTWTSTDFIESIKNYKKALTLISGSKRPPLLKVLARIYHDIGFGDKAKDYYSQALELDRDSSDYFANLASIEFSKGNFEKANLLHERAYKIDSTKIPSCEIYSILGQDQKAYIYAKKRINEIVKKGYLPLYDSHRLGYAFWKAGKFKEADYFFKEQIKYDSESIRLGREIAIGKSAQYDLAAVYAFLGDKTKAYQNLREWVKLSVCPLWWLTYLKYDPLFASIRNDTEFQQIVRDMTAKYQAEHERVKKWLEEQGMLEKEL